jgi:hypothetical protein
VVTLARVHEMTFPVEVRDVAFWDDGTLLLTTPSAELWRVDVVAPGESDLLHPASRVLQPVAEALSSPNVEPACGGYPRLAASALAGVIIVNTSDLTLVALPWSGEVAARLLHLGCGEYYPRMAFSRDGSRFFACADRLLIFDTGSWKKKHARNASEVCTWHPLEPRLLGLDACTGRLKWTDWRNVAKPTARAVGTLDLSECRVEPAGLVVDATADRCVTAYHHPDRLEWWQLQPLRLIAVRPVGEVFDLYPGPRAEVFAVETEAGVQLWDLEARMPVSDVIGGSSGVKFSPSGLWCVTLSRVPTNPGEVKRTVTLWKVLW